MTKSIANTTKLCPGCGVTKPVTAFCRSAAQRDGYGHTCRTCQSISHRESRARMRARSDEEVEAAAARRPPRACRTCKQVKPFDKYPRDRGRSDGRGTLCLVCSAEATRYYNKVVGPEAVRERNARSYRKYKTSVRNYRLYKKFGMTLDEYSALHAEQDDLCAICKEPERQENRNGQLSVDHDHETGVVRELLCNSCNHGLGQFRDSPESLMRAAEYITHHRALQEHQQAT